MKIPHFQGVYAANVDFLCDMHGCKVDLVNAKIHLVKNYVYLVMTICIFSVTIYVLMELMGAMDGCDG